MLLIRVLAFAVNVIIIVGDICPLPDLDFCDKVAINAESPTANQLVIFREDNPAPIGDLTTLVGKPIEVNAIDNFLNSNQPPFYNDLLETIFHFNRERIFPRTVHANGGGAFGFFNVTNDVSAILASVDAFNGIGKITDVIVRFSTTKNEFGSQDTIRDARGFAVKFTPKTGAVFDLLSLSVPLFSIKDPKTFTVFTKAQKRNPQTHRTDFNSFADLAVNNEETFNFFLRVYSDLGIPCKYQKMPGFTINTLAGCDSDGNIRYCRFRWQPDAGVEGLSSEDAVRIAGENDKYFNDLLYDQIARGDFPTWTLSVQSLTQKDVDNAKFNVFDTTHELTEAEYPYVDIGTMTLNRNPENYFRDIEQAIFCAKNLPEGLQGVPGDKIFEMRSFIYQDAQNHRTGANHNKIQVNRPTSLVTTNQRDGVSPVLGNGGKAPNYYPNSFNGAVIVAQPRCPELNFTVYINPEPDNFQQASDHFHSLPNDHQERIIANVVETLAFITAKDLLEKYLKLFSKVDRELGSRVRTAYEKQLKTCPVPRRRPNTGQNKVTQNALLDRLQKIICFAA